MSFGADDGETSGSLHLWRELDVGTTTCHVGGYGDGSKSVGALSGKGNDIRLLLVQLGVEHLTRYFSHVEHALEEL